MSVVARTLGVARSNLAARKTGETKPRGRYRKEEDATLLPLIRALVDERPCYGYRRICALANRKLRADGKLLVNMKRVLRIMQNNDLTLERHTARRPGRTRDGVIAAPRSNHRWCSDHLEIRARNGEVVRGLFIIDACDREIIAWSPVANGGVSGEMVRDLMVAALEQRFGALTTPHQVEWLSNNGSADTARGLGLLLLFTPVRSPESNGMSESFVKTLKRDYARLVILPDAETILAKLPGWIEDYCEVHPHSALKFRSPQEFIRLSA